MGILRFFTLCLLLPLISCDNNIVQIESGWIEGTTAAAGDIRIFKGIPFAAPPVGELHLKFWESYFEK